MIRRVLFTALVLALSACKDDPVHPPPADPGSSTYGGGGGGGGASDASTPSDSGTATDGGACTDLAIGGSVTDEEAVADNPPAGSGTVLTDGTYNLNLAQVFVGNAQAGPTGNTYRSTIRITSGTTFERVVISAAQGGTPTETRSRGVIATVGVTATISLSCPGATQEQLSFTATSTQLVLTNLVTKRQWTYVRAP